MCFLQESTKNILQNPACPVGIYVVLGLILSNNNIPFIGRLAQNRYGSGGTSQYRKRFRARAKITSHFCISVSAHLWPMPHFQNPRNSPLFLWICSFGSAKPEPNLNANSVKLFLREPLIEIEEMLNKPMNVEHRTSNVQHRIKEFTWNDNGRRCSYG